MMKTKAAKTTAAAALALLATSCDGFSPAAPAGPRSATAVRSAPRDVEGAAVEGCDRRSVLSSLLTTAAAGSAAFLPREALAEGETMERGGVKLTPFNSLPNNYRGGSNPTVDASTINEPTMPYSEFLEKLGSGQVEFVTFLAPNGDAAYATIKSSGEGGEEGTTNKPIRIGEGYPVEDPGGWSSPAFVIKAVAKKGVPYKFVVPGLGDSFNLSGKEAGGYNF